MSPRDLALQDARDVHVSTCLYRLLSAPLVGLQAVSSEALPKGVRVSTDQRSRADAGARARARASALTFTHQSMFFHRHQDRIEEGGRLQPDPERAWGCPMSNAPQLETDRVATLLRGEVSNFFLPGWASAHGASVVGDRLSLVAHLPWSCRRSAKPCWPASPSSSVVTSQGVEVVNFSAYITPLTDGGRNGCISSQPQRRLQRQRSKRGRPPGGHRMSKAPQLETGPISLFSRAQVRGGGGKPKHRSVNRERIEMSKQTPATVVAFHAIGLMHGVPLPSPLSRESEMLRQAMRCMLASEAYPLAVSADRNMLALEVLRALNARQAGEVVAAKARLDRGGE